MEVNPRNEIERTYAILVVLSGVVMFSSLVSTITNTMTKLRERNAERAIQRHLVRQYLSDARISVRLAHRIFSFLRKQGYIVQSRLHEGDVAVLKELPEKTLKHLHCEVYAPALVAHPFFHRFDELDGTGFIDICHQAVSQKFASEEGEVFHYGTACTAMYIVRAGKLVYTAGRDDVDKPRLVRAGERLCEAAIWLRWLHHGRLVADCRCELTMLNAAPCHKVFQRSPLFEKCKQYAMSFLKNLIEASQNDSDGVSDMWGDFELLQDMTFQAFDDGIGEGNHSESGSSNRSLSSLLTFFGSGTNSLRNFFSRRSFFTNNQDGTWSLRK